MARAGLNIHNMVNKSRGDMAYTLVDIDSPIGPDALATIAVAGGVIIPGSCHGGDDMRGEIHFADHRIQVVGNVQAAFAV